MRLQSLTHRVRRELGSRRPPACPPGWRTGPPTFVGIGAQRAGTTWWYHLVTAHPGVQAGAAKELRYFDPWFRREFGDADADEYARFFPRPLGAQVGEWSPGYMSHFWIPPLLHRAAPDTRLLVLLRDPVERYRSGLALQSETRRATQSSASTAFRLGCYATHLEHVFGSFPRAQVLVQLHERCVADPVTELARTYRFLGLDDSFVPDDVATPRNTTNTPKAALPTHVHGALVSAYAGEVRRLASVLPDLDLSPWPNFAAGT